MTFNLLSNLELIEMHKEFIKTNKAVKSSNKRRLDEEAQLSSIIYKIFLEAKRDLLNEIREDRKKKNELVNIKNDYIEKIVEKFKNYLNNSVLKQKLEDTIKNRMTGSWEEAEVELNINVVHPKEGIYDFLVDHAHKNFIGLTEEFSKKIRGEIGRGMMNRETMYKIEKRIGKIFEGSKERIQKIVATEMINARVQAKLTAYENSGIKGVKKSWIAKLDNNTCDICKALNRKYNGEENAISIKKDFVVAQWRGKAPVVHPYCRCSIRYHIYKIK